MAKEQNKWQAHPNKKRKEQKNAFVDALGSHWRSSDPEKDVDINACVVYDVKTDEYFVFITTDLQKTAKQIIMTY